MMNNSPDAAHRRKGIFLLVMPMILLPMLFLLVYNAEPVSAETKEPTKGMNLEMPKPVLANKQESKADAYVFEKENPEEKTPWGLPDFLVNQPEPENLTESGFEKVQFGFSPVSNQQGAWESSLKGIEGQNAGSNPEAEMIQQLRELEALLRQDTEKKPDFGSSVAPSTPVNSEIRQVQELMGAMESKPQVPDPEMQQLEQLIDKLLVLQNPRLAVPEKAGLDDIKPVAMLESESEQVASVSPEEVNGFFGLSGNVEPVIPERKAFRKTIAASVAKTQEIFPGEAIEIRLDQDLRLESGTISAGTVLFGQTTISGSRLQLTISGILQNNSLIPVSLKAYGLDGIPGIELGDVKGSAQWLKETSNSAQGININSYGMDWQSQLATSGVEATRSLLRNKTRVKKLEIKSGHPFLLIDSSTSNSQNL